MSEEQSLANFQELMEIVLKHHDYCYLWKEAEDASGASCIINESFAFKEEKPCSPKDESCWLFLEP